MAIPGLRATRRRARKVLSRSARRRKLWEERRSAGTVPSFLSPHHRARTHAVISQSADMSADTTRCNEDAVQPVDDTTRVSVAMEAMLSLRNGQFSENATAYASDDTLVPSQEATCLDASGCLDSQWYNHVAATAESPSFIILDPRLAHQNVSWSDVVGALVTCDAHDDSNTKQTARSNEIHYRYDEWLSEAIEHVLGPKPGLVDNGKVTSYSSNNEQIAQPNEIHYRYDEWLSEAIDHVMGPNLV